MVIIQAIAPKIYLFVTLVIILMKCIYVNDKCIVYVYYKIFKIARATNEITFGYFEASFI